MPLWDRIVHWWRRLSPCLSGEGHSYNIAYDGRGRVMLRCIWCEAETTGWDTRPVLGGRP